MIEVKLSEKDLQTLLKSTRQMIFAQDLSGEYDYRLINTMSILNKDEKQIKDDLNSFVEANKCSLVEAASSLYVDQEFKDVVKKEFINLFRNNKCYFLIKINTLDDQGRKKWIKVTFIIQEEKGTASKLLGFFADVTDSKYEAMALEEATRRDLFTGLFNKTNAFKLINKKIETSAKTKKCAFAILDIDNFKHFNDFFGHDIGDLVLETVAKTLNNNVSDKDIVGRFGGDEFIIFIEEYESEGKLKEKLKQFLSYSVGIHTVKASIGISILNKDATTFNRLFKHADEALYVAKKNEEKIAFYNGEKA